VSPPFDGLCRRAENRPVAPRGRPKKTPGSEPVTDLAWRGRLLAFSAAEGKQLQTEAKLQASVSRPPRKVVSKVPMDGGSMTWTFDANNPPRMTIRQRAERVARAASAPRSIDLSKVGALIRAYSKLSENAGGRGKKQDRGAVDEACHALFHVGEDTIMRQTRRLRKG
jgi:hypothetical protein